MDSKLLGKRINMARKDSGMTGEKLAEMCNINPTYLRQLECGAKLPSLPMFVELCKVLRVSPSYLLADILPETETGEMDILLKLWSCATPSQIRLITSIARGALDAIDET